LWCLYSVIASVERPRAAKDAVPWATPAEFNGSGRIELADEIFPAVSREMAGGRQIVERLHERWRRTPVIECHAAGNLFHVAPVLRDRLQQSFDRRFAFTGQHAIHSTVGVPQDFVGNKRDAVAAN